MDKETKDAIHAVLTKLENEGRLAPDPVIEEARNPDSPLHGQFQWDVEKAAMITWRAQARSLISQFHITVTVHRTEYRIQEFVEAPSKPENEQGYVAFSKLKSNKDLAREFIDRELGIASTYVSKTTDYARVLGLEKRVEKVVKEITSLRVDVQNNPAARKPTQHAA